MLKIENLTKTYRTQHGEVTVLDRINLTIQPGEKIGILGLNGSGKSTLIRLIGGVELPTSGVIHRDMSISWPLAFQGGFQVSLTGLDNLRFICRIYNTPIAEAQAFVEDFSELGDYLKEPVKTYSAGMFARLSFAISMAIDFDCYLIDEVLTVGDRRFQERCNYELFDKRSDRSMIIVSHVAEVIKSHCDSIFVLKNSQMKRFDDVDEAYIYYADDQAN
jgi:capsular polysaccharide transport system ATP-binding protein